MTESFNMEEKQLKGHEILELMKTIYCSLDKKTFYEILGIKDWPYKEEFDDILNIMRVDLFTGLCRLDRGNVDKIFEWAKNKRSK